MKKTMFYALCLMGLGFGVFSCQQESVVAEKAQVPEKVIHRLLEMGFNPDGIEVVEGGYRIERDIIITDDFLEHSHEDMRVPNHEQYRSTLLVSTASGARNIKIYAPQGGNSGYSPGMIAGLDVAIARYNAEGLNITFTRITTSTGADIVMTRLTKAQERQGVLGSAGFPTSTGNPYGTIKMSGVLESSYGLNANQIGTIIAHEMGHCIGLRHTDYYNRNISCGSGGGGAEGVDPYGAVHIPGTPTTATLAGKSYMLACTDGSDRPFNNDDKVALDFMY
jgi:hypothetical protein